MVRLLGMLAAASALHLVLALPAQAQGSGSAGTGGASNGSAATAAGATAAPGDAGTPATPGTAPATPSTDDAAPANSGSSPSAQNDASATGTPAGAVAAGAPARDTGTEPNSEIASATPEDAERARRIIDACMLPPIKLSAQEVEDFLANPTSLLTTYGGQSLTLSNRVRSLAGSDGRTLAPILALARDSTEDQKAGIGSGLGRTAFLCQGSNPDYAAEIQSQIAQISSPSLLTAFLTATNDMQVAAIGAGGPGASAAGAPGLSGGGISGPGSAGEAGDATVGNLSNVFSSRGGGGVILGDSGDGGSNSTTINIFVNPSVSPSTLN